MTCAWPNLGEGGLPFTSSDFHLSYWSGLLLDGDHDNDTDDYDDITDDDSIIDADDDDDNLLKLGGVHVKNM